jgi:hypothetical protein
MPMKKNKRLLMVAVPVLIILFSLVIYEYAYLGYKAERASYRERRETKMKTLNKYITVLAERSDLERQVAGLKEQEKTLKSKLIEGEPVSLASANLQGIVKGIITGRGGTITSERIGKPEDLEKASLPTPASMTPSAKGAAGKKTEKLPEGQKFQVVSVSIDATVPDAAALSDILYSIETRTPYLVIKELDARVRNFKEPRELMVRMDVMSLYGGK